MENNIFNEYVENRYKRLLDWYDKKSIYNKRITYLLQIPLIIIAASVPVLASFEYQLLTVLFSVIVAAGMGILRFGKFEYLWRNYRGSWEILQREMTYYKMKIDIYEKANDPEKLFIERVEKHLSTEYVRFDAALEGSSDNINP